MCDATNPIKQANITSSADEPIKGLDSKVTDRTAQAAEQIQNIIHRNELVEGLHALQRLFMESKRFKQSIEMSVKIKEAPANTRCSRRCIWYGTEIVAIAMMHPAIPKVTPRLDQSVMMGFEWARSVARCLTTKNAAPRTAEIVIPNVATALPGSLENATETKNRLPLMWPLEVARPKARNKVMVWETR